MVKAAFRAACFSHENFEFDTGNFTDSFRFDARLKLFEFTLKNLTGEKSDELTTSARPEGQTQSLTSRERDVLWMVVSGMLNKQIAAQLGTAENTVKVHRKRAMEKMGARSLAELIRMIERLKGPLKKVS